MRKKLIVANWKMNPETPKRAKLLFLAIKRGLKKIQNLKIIICPPFPYLSIIKAQLSPIKLGAQNCFWEEKGAFTGEVSPKMLKKLGVEYVILGHSERRKILGEMDIMINKKVKLALKMRLKVILCVGETKIERKEGKTFKVLQNQLKNCLKEIEKKDFKNLILAYEPVWAIGTGNFCRPEDAKNVLLFLKRKFENLPILYGGSVNAKNAKDYIEVGFDGVLVGSASLKSKEFLKILKNLNS